MFKENLTGNLYNTRGDLSLDPKVSSTVHKRFLLTVKINLKYGLV